MATLKELRNRLNSVKATQKSTSAMRMVAASKLRRAQDAAEAARWGLVNRIHPAADLMREAHALAGLLASGPPLVAPDEKPAT